MTRRTRVAPAAAAAGLAIFTWACDGRGPSTPSAPILVNAVVLAPTAMSISPNVGSTSGDTPVVITGTGLQPGLTVTFDGVPAQARFDSRYVDRIYLSTLPHADGAVDVVVTNANGQAGRLARSYTYAAPQSFDFNGTWSGFPVDGSDLPVEFTIQNDGLVRAACDTTVVIFAPPVPLTNGAFSFSRDGSVTTGKIVSASQAVGAIALAPCNAPLWEATRKP